MISSKTLSEEWTDFLTFAGLCVKTSIFVLLSILLLRFLLRVCKALSRFFGIVWKPDYCYIFLNKIDESICEHLFIYTDIYKINSIIENFFVEKILHFFVNYFIRHFLLHFLLHFFLCLLLHLLILYFSHVCFRNLLCKFKLYTFIFLLIKFICVINFIWLNADVLFKSQANFFIF